MASASDRGNLAGEYSLNELYQQLRGLELSDQRLNRQIRQVGYYQHRMRSTGSEDDTSTATEVPREFLDAQHTTLSDCQRLLGRLSEMLRKDINLRSRPSLRSLTILDIPDEILVRIFEYVKGWHPDPQYSPFMYEHGAAEIKNLRLTCWCFCNASSHLLLPLVRVELDSASVAHLDTVSQHPTIRKGVRAVRVVLDYYDYELANNIEFFAEYSAYNLRERTDMSEWMALNKSADSVESDMEPIRKAREYENLWMSFAGVAVDDTTQTANQSGLNLLRRAHEEYRSRAADQNEVFENRAFVRSVTTAIGRMPLVTRLEFRELDSESPRWRSPVPLLQGDDDHLLWQMLLPMRWDVGRQWALGTPHVEVLVDLPTAVHEAGTVLKGFDFEISSLPECHGILTAEETRRLSMAVQQVKNIRIELRGYRLADSEDALNPADVDYFHLYIDALFNTDSIESISLNLDCFNTGDTGVTPPLTDLGSLMTFRVWENLLKVTWNCVSLYHTDMERFFQQLQKPLQFLYLSGVHLLSGSWAETLEILRAAPTGYSVTLSHPLGAECEYLSVEEKAKIFDKPDDDIWAESQAEEYILGYSGVNPLKPVEVDHGDTSSVQ